MLKNWAIEEFSCPETDQVTIHTSWLPTIGNGLNEQNWTNQSLFVGCESNMSDQNFLVATLTLIIFSRTLLQQGEDYYPSFDGGEKILDEQNKTVRRVQITQDGDVTYINLQNSTLYEVSTMLRNWQECVGVILNKLIVREVFVLPRYNLIAKLWHTLLLP